MAEEEEFDIPPPPPMTCLGDVVAGMVLPKQEALVKTEGPKKQTIEHEIGALQLKNTKAGLAKTDGPQKSNLPDHNDELTSMIQAGRSRLRKVGQRRPSMGDAIGLATNAPVKYPMPTKASTNPSPNASPQPGSRKINAPPPLPVCAGCHLTIQAGEDGMEIGEGLDTKMYHPKCFRCTKCNQIMEEGGYSFLQSTRVASGQELYHETCLSCTTCSMLLKTNVFTAIPPDGGLFYCREHVPRPLCVRCDNKIWGKCVQVGGLKYHAECFVCHVCQKSIAGPYVPEANGALTCEKCYESKNKCTKCQTILSGAALNLTADDGSVHSIHAHCFTCFTCGTDLNNEKAGSFKGQFYCVPHWREAKQKK